MKCNVQRWLPLSTFRSHVDNAIPKAVWETCARFSSFVSEPSWEARFEGTSYGFRPGRSPQDAIGRVYQMSLPTRRKKWVVDADIEGAFDNIDHEHLLNAIGQAPGRELVRLRLKAGYVDLGSLSLD